ncbi:MAG: HPr family phosphocarrier protein [Leptotrichia wadei]|uniref:HPr family phosphocarrier protein n=1 Tax=Leptotrichia wadei TaxID=157687 RepID=UPI0026EB1C7C|nr:HPr family phosphocarrier protein [Leptotrichia wadei]MBS6019699.1 HPr family phosphocarrier protein [Leptotrichia wadei]
MVSKTIIFNYRYGIDIYFATEVMRKAREFESKIVIEYDGKKIKNKSPLMLSGFGIKMGSEITIYADGADEKEALETVSNLLGIIAEEDICKQEMANVDEHEELEKEKNKSPEEIEKELEKIIEEAASNKDNLTIGKRIMCSRRNNQLGIGRNIWGYIIPPFDLMAGPDFDVKTSIERIWDVMVYRIDKKFRINNSMWTIVPAIKKKIKDIIEEDVKKNNLEEKLAESMTPYVYFNVPGSIMSQVTRKLGNAYIISLKNTLKYEDSGEIIVPTYKEFLMEFDRNFEMPKIEWWW